MGHEAEHSELSRFRKFQILEVHPRPGLTFDESRNKMSRCHAAMSRSKKGSQSEFVSKFGRNEIC